MSAHNASIEFSLDLDAIEGRTDQQLKQAVIEARQALAAAEQARATAERARATAVQDLEDITAQRDRLRLKNRTLTNENDVLLKRISELKTQLAAATDTDQQYALKLELDKIERRLADRNRAMFGSSKSERRGTKTGDGAKDRDKEPQTGHGPTPQPDLPIEDKLYELPDEELAAGCPACRGQLELWEGHVEETEEITVERVRYKMRRNQRQQYKCTCCRHIVTAPGPDRLVPGGRYSNEFAINVAIDKYADHLPLERQVKRMERAGLSVTSQTLWDQIERLHILLMPTLLALHARILQADLVYADETSWRMMGTGRSKKWWLWMLSDGARVYCLMMPTRGAAAARQLFKDYAGIVMADDYSVYRSLEKGRSNAGGRQVIIDEDGRRIPVPTPDYTLATCWMHARRYLYRAERHHEQQATPALDIIDALFALEAEARRRADDGEDLLAVREELRAGRGRALIDELDTWRNELRPLPGSALAKAVDHLDRLWSRLVLILEDPRIPMDNGLVERRIRDPVIGRKNFQGSRSPTGARVAALFYSLIGTCKLMGLDPHAYLCAAVEHVLEEPGSVFLPQDFAAMTAAKDDAGDG